MIMVETNSFTLSRIASVEKETLPTEVCTIPVLSTLKSILPCFTSRIAFAVQQTYTDRMHLRAVYENGEGRVCDEVFDRRDILPRGYLKENEAVYIYPFHEKHNCLGSVCSYISEALVAEIRLHYFCRTV